MFSPCGFADIANVYFFMQMHLKFKRASSRAHVLALKLALLSISLCIDSQSFDGHLVATLSLSLHGALSLTLWQLGLQVCDARVELWHKQLISTLPKAAAIRTTTAESSRNVGYNTDFLHTVTSQSHPHSNPLWQTTLFHL